MKIDIINGFTEEEARDAFLKCCGSESWAGSMTEARPFANDDDLLKQVDRSFMHLSKEDWLEAFAAHPKIGDIESLKKKFGNTKDWAEGEQSGVNGTAEAVLEKLALGNKTYEDRFGYIFIVCATGKSAEEMLTILEGRIDNQPEKEFAIAAEEQKKITQIRLAKL